MEACTGSYKLVKPVLPKNILWSFVKIGVRSRKSIRPVNVIGCVTPQKAGESLNNLRKRVILYNLCSRKKSFL